MPDLFNVQNLIAKPAAAAPAETPGQLPNGQSAATPNTPTEPVTGAPSEGKELSKAAGTEPAAAGEGQQQQTTAAPNNLPDTQQQQSIKTEQPPAPGPVAPSLPGVDPAAETAETPEQAAARQQNEITLRAAENAKRQLLEELGFSSVDELRSKIMPVEPETEEQKKRREDLHRAAVQEYAVRELEMSPDDFTRIQQVQGQTDRDLVFDLFKREWIALNKDNPDFKDKDLDKEAAYEFDAFYHLSSENVRMKANGELALKKAAEQLRAQETARWQNAEQQYNDSVAFKQNVGRFKQTIQSTLRQAMPKEFTWDVEGGGKVTFQLDKVDLKALESYLVNENNFQYFLQKGGTDAAKMLESEIKRYIAANHYQDMVTTAIKTAHDVGLKSGAVGAKAPFQTPAVTTPAPTNETLSEADKAKIRQVAGGGF